jgi:hypothetical protein
MTTLRPNVLAHELLSRAGGDPATLPYDYVRNYESLAFADASLDGSVVVVDTDRDGT